MVFPTKVINLYHYQTTFIDVQKDHLPFASRILKIAESMPNAPQKPKLKLRMTQEFFSVS